MKKIILLFVLLLSFTSLVMAQGKRAGFKERKSSTFILLTESGDTVKVSNGLLWADSIATYSLTIYSLVDTQKTFIVDTSGFEVRSPRMPGFSFQENGTGILGDTVATKNSKLYSFYKWYSSATSLQYIDIYLFWQPPAWFPGFNSTSSDSAVIIDFFTQSNSDINNKFDVTIYKYNATGTTISQTGIVGTVAGTMYSKADGNALVDFKGDRSVLSSMTSTDILVVQMRLYSKDSYRVYISNIWFSW